MADNDRAILQTQLKQLQSATNIVLMVVPYGVAFAIRLNEKSLPKNSCVYQIDLVPGPASDEILKILNESIHDYQKGTQRKIEIRLGIVFKVENRVLQEFYFEDWGGKSDVEGFSGNYRIVASANFPTRLRALLTHPNVILTKDLSGLCPHS